MFRRVHVSKATLGLLGEDYDWEPGDGATRDPLLAQYHIETFLILPKQQVILKPIFICLKVCMNVC